MSNLPSQGYTILKARTSQYPARPNGSTTDWANSNGDLGGMNSSGAAGIGIATNVPNPKFSDWDLLDQELATRTPQDTQYIGGDGVVVASVSAGPNDGNALTTPIYYAKYVGAPANQTAGPGSSNFADDAQFVQVLVGPVAPGAEIDTSGVFNESDFTLETGDTIWGVNQ